MLRLDWCSHEAASYACEHWHYAEVIPKSKLAKIGVWEDEQFRGAVVFGVGATSDLVKRYGLRMEQGCELVRIALRSHCTPVSRIVAIALKILVKTYPGLRLVVSFSDPAYGHHGGIYQGGGWIYTGQSPSTDEYLYRGKRWHGRAFRHLYRGLEHHPDVHIVKGSAKHRYLMPLDDEIRVRIAHLAKPYPKRVRSAENGTAAPTAGGGVIPTRTLHP